MWSGISLEILKSDLLYFLRAVLGSQLSWPEGKFPIYGTLPAMRMASSIHLLKLVNFTDTPFPPSQWTSGLLLGVTYFRGLHKRMTHAHHYSTTESSFTLKTVPWIVTLSSHLTRVCAFSFMALGIKLGLTNTTQVLRSLPLEFCLQFCFSGIDTSVPQSDSCRMAPLQTGLLRLLTFLTFHR